MNDVTQSLQELIKKQIHQEQFDVVGIVPIPATGDRMVRLRTLQEILEDFDTSNEKNTVEYILQIKPKPVAKVETAPPKNPTENVYLANGKLNFPYLMKNADLLYDTSEYALARNIYKTILKSGEFTSVALLKLGRCFESEGKIAEAKAHYEESIAYHPSLEPYQRLSVLLIRQGKDQQAAETLERALNLKDLSSSIRFEFLKSCGNCWTRAKKTEEAEKAFKKALELQPSADDIRSNLGVLHLQNNKIGEAKRNFQDAIASNPKNPQALSGLGSCYLAEGDKKSAHDYFSRSLELDLNNPTSIFYLVKCAYELKSYATAARILGEYIQISPVNPNLLYSLAGLQFHLGRMSESKSTTLKILELNPKHAGAKDLLNMIEKYTASHG